METEEQFYTRHLSDLFGIIQNAKIESINYFEDTPTFPLIEIPFKFRYCLEVHLYTNAGNFRLFTPQTANGLNTFMIAKLTASSNKLNHDIINETAKSITFENSRFGLPYKIQLEFQDKIKIMYCAEIHETNKNEFDYKINDEMILVFDTHNDAKLFEGIITTANNG